MEWDGIGSYNRKFELGFVVQPVDGVVWKMFAMPNLKERLSASYKTQ